MTKGKIVNLGRMRLSGSLAVNAVPYTGGLSITSGDDRQGTSSQTMQDNKILFSFPQP